MNNVKLCILAIFMFLIALVPCFAETPVLDYVYKIDTQGIISRPCFNSIDGDTYGWCSNETICQISVFDPDNTIMLNGVNLTNQVSTHNFTLPKLNDSGIYKVDMACSANNKTGYDTFWFGVNLAGRDYTRSGFLLWIVGALTLLFGALAYIMRDSLRLSFLLLTFTMLPVGLWVSLDIARNTFMGSAVINLLLTGFLVSFTGYIAMVLYIMILLLKQLKISKNRLNSARLGEKGSPLYWQKKERYKERHPNREYR